MPMVDGEICDGIDDDGDKLIDEGFDIDGDSVADCFDNCPLHANKDQEDSVGDGTGNACRAYNDNVVAYMMALVQFCESPNKNRDSDRDGISDCSDNCPFHHNPGQEDTVRVISSVEVEIEGINIGAPNDELGGDACEKTYIQNLAPYVERLTK